MMTTEISAVQVRTIYIQQRRFWEEQRSGQSTFGRRPMPRWDGGTDGDGRCCQPVWPRLAEFYAQNNLDPNQHMAAAFCKATTYPPTPVQLLSIKLLQKAAAVDQTQECERAHVALNHQLGVFQRELDKRSHGRCFALGWLPQQILTGILLDSSLSLSALFRYCLAAKYKMHSIMRLYLSTATQQYAANPEIYEQVWGPVIPPSLKQKLKRC